MDNLRGSSLGCALVGLAAPPWTCIWAIRAVFSLIEAESIVFCLLKLDVAVVVVEVAVVLLAAVVALLPPTGGKHYKNYNNMLDSKGKLSDAIRLTEPMALDRPVVAG